uniref:Uncharacterized protein n=1 Tax=Arundo donax TaxID=35708 RepID=A0A0A9A138_ARUDO
MSPDENACYMRALTSPPLT